MDQEDALDFKALRAKFQLDENVLKQPKPPTIKPAVPDKPKLVPPPTSPTAYLPAGARPSLLTSINHSAEGRTAGAPRVIFKEGKKEIKMPLIQVNTKGKDKTSELKLKKTKDKTAKGDDSADQKPKKKLPLLPMAPKESTAELVAAPAPPKKKGFLGFRRTSKTSASAEVPADAILDTPSIDFPGPAPLIPAPVIPAPSEFGDVPPAPQFAAPKALLPNIPTIIPDSSAAQVEITSPSNIPASPNFAPPPAFIPEIPTPTVTTPESETPPEIETPALHISRPVSPNDSIQGPPSAAPTPPPSRAISRRPPTAEVSALALLPPSPPEVVAPVAIEAEVETPPTPPATDPASGPPSPKAERSISALSALSRAEDMSPAKKCDHRIFNLLAKARRKNSNPTSPRPFSMTPSEDLPSSPTDSSLDFPPTDYQGNPPKPVNGLDHRQVSPVLDGITDAVPERLVIPPVPPKKVLPDLPSLGLPPVKPERPRSANLSGFIPPTPVEDNEIPSTPGFTETDAPEFDDVVSDANSPGLQVSDWGNGDYEGPDSPDRQNLPEFFGNGMTPPGAEVHAEPVSGSQYQHSLLPKTSLPVFEGSPQLPRLQADVADGDYESTDNVYEDVGALGGKKKGKPDVGKKRKGPPKNPYATEAQPEVTNEEKVKTGRFGKNDKKAAAEGPDEKELKKREKQRIEKEKKELKERQEREKKEQKEREKRENEMKKKFKVTGQEDAMYQAQVTVTTKGRKNDLPVTSGDIVSIIRTTNCPKGKWLARDSSNNNYGYIAVDHVKLDIEEMLKLGKKAGITRQISKTNVPEEEDTHADSGPSNHYPNQGESFEDDSEEWTADDEEPFSPPTDTIDYSATLLPTSHSRAFSMPDMGNKDLSINHQHSRSDINSDGSSHVEARHEALQKLATFFHSPKPVEPAASRSVPETSPVLVEEEAAPLPEASATQEADLDPTDMLILPPPDLYA